MTRRHYRLTLDDALDAHDLALQFGGGRPGELNRGSIESAIGRPYSGYHRPIRRKAAALVESMAGNHGFADGNKRTTLILLGLLLGRSGYRLNASNHEVEEMILSVAKGELNFDGIHDWLKERVERKPPRR